MSGSRAVGFATWIDGEASSTVDALHEEESAGSKKKRHQGKQACQQCRRRKTKCDETRPKCKSCGKAKLTCEYELPAGQTRQQALVEHQSKIQHELEAHASLISTLRTLPSDAAVEVLNRLREGQYDGILIGRRESQDGTEVQHASFPWEYPVDNAEDDASGEDDEANSDATVSLPQSYTQSIGYNMALSSSQQSTQVASMPFTGMPQVDQNLPHPGYYAPYVAYQTPAGGQQSLSMGIPAEQLRHGRMKMFQQVSRQFSQQFHMGPPAEQSHIATEQRSKRTPH
ncbi:hypothetical protein B0A48_18758 [Cryoendolithus antarcticus]|uniref:Zn(2)-C6 fungal-type domain-containing protein n=1 Tax=Cryoendolithus antarcticus TaxID=1507870 RepID=A0A1V8S7Z7_9PEZI|nr:hypothetical protein B0A48_18758 [Cryoendolithus antarcticus]